LASAFFSSALCAELSLMLSLIVAFLTGCSFEGLTVFIFLGETSFFSTAFTFFASGFLAETFAFIPVIFLV
jgi:hypothetical protein